MDSLEAEEGVVTDVKMQQEGGKEKEKSPVAVLTSVVEEVEDN